MPILVPALVDRQPEDYNPFPANLHTVASILPTIKPVPGLKKKTIIVKFRRDFGLNSTRKYWPENMKYDRYEIVNESENGANPCICDVIK